MNECQKLNLSKAKFKLLTKKPINTFPEIKEDIDENMFYMLWKNSNAYTPPTKEPFIAYSEGRYVVVQYQEGKFVEYANPENIIDNIEYWQYLFKIDEIGKLDEEYVRVYSGYSSKKSLMPLYESFKKNASVIFKDFYDFVKYLRNI